MILKKYDLVFIATITIFILISIACNMSITNTPEIETPIVEQKQPSERHTIVLTPVETALPTETLMPTYTPTSDVGIGSDRVNEADGATLVYVPEGEFLMGSNDEFAWESEKPEHLVYLDAYWIYLHEVTNDKFRLCVEDNVCKEPRDVTAFESSSYGDHPVVFVNWYDAETYCEWAGGRLPTEAEWEKAARGTDGRMYPWGDESPDCNLANFLDCYGGSSPVGFYPDGASPYGALDMVGNALEWVSDWYDENYYRFSPYNNPTGPATGTTRVFRGGEAYTFSGRPIRITSRYFTSPESSYSLDLGFRCVIDVFP